MQTYPIGTVLSWGNARETAFRGDALQEMRDRGWILDFAEGQVVATAPLTRLFRGFQELFRQEVAGPLGFEEWTLPRLLPQKILRRFGSVEYAPGTLFEARYYSESHPGRSYFLDPVQSAGLYHALSKHPLPTDILPLKVFETLGGPQWRNEAPSELHGIDKLVEYLKMEHVYVGTPEQVTESRRIQKQTYERIFDELGLVYRVVVGAPCHSSPQNTARYEKAKTLDEVPLIDFELYIPSEDRWMEVCGACVEETENTEAFGITSTSGDVLWSGCSGVGLHRLAYAFLAQMGFDEKNYPELFLRHLPPVGAVQFSGRP